MTIAWGRVLPVIVSILIIIAVAVLRDRSRLLAAILATMPTNIPLALWVLSGGEAFQQADFADVLQNILFGLVPTFVFVIIALLAARAGWSLVPMLLAGYLGWGVVLGISFWFGLFKIQ
jgi:hypothetical protein